MNSAVPLQTWPPARRPGAARPAVLFLDDFGYEQFDQLAGSLRRRGIATIGLRTGPPPRRPFPYKLSRAFRDHWFYDRQLRLGEAEAESLLDQDGEAAFQVLDVLLTEPAVAVLGLDNPSLQRLGLHAGAASRRPVGRLLDKFEANRLMEQAGLPIPRQICAREATPEAAAQALGFPLVVKARIGLGGDGVRIVRSIEELILARDELDPPRGRGVFYQAYVAGIPVGYGCVQGPDGPLLDRGFRIGATQWECGPSAQVWMDDDPALLQAGQRAVKALGCQGFVQIDLLKGSDGQLRPIDANLRPWGNAFSLLCLDVDFASAYACLILGAGYTPPEPCGAEEQQADVFPFALYEAVGHGSLRRMGALGLRFGRMCRRGPGPAYGAIVAAKAAVLLTERLLGVPLLARPRPRGRPNEVPVRGLHA